MSKRSSASKKLARLRKEFNRTPLPAFIDLINWVKDHSDATTNQQAIKLILAGKVKSESHTIGIAEETRLDVTGTKTEKVKVVTPRVPATLRDTLQVTA